MSSTLRRLRWLLLLGVIAACEVNPQPPLPANGGNSAGTATNLPGGGNAASGGGSGTGTGPDLDPSLNSGGENLGAEPHPEAPGAGGVGGESGGGGEGGGAGGNEDALAFGGSP